MSERVIVLVLGFNRPYALQRLLNSLEAVEDAGLRADLVVSLDGGGDPDCEVVANNMGRWAYGKTTVCVQPQRMGLKAHIESAVDRVRDYDAIIVLEDDLSVSPWMLHFASSVIKTYRFSEEIGQISLYSPRVNEFASQLPFEPVRSRSDVWFSRAPSSYGQMWTREQWFEYRKFRQNYAPCRYSKLIPKQANNWKNSWKRDFFHYLVRRRKWVAVPYVSLSTNHGDPGEHFANSARCLEAPLEGFRRDYRLTQPGDSPVRYDPWLEPLAEDLPFEKMGYKPAQITVDTFGCKDLSAIETPYVLSTRPCRRPLIRFADYLRPIEMNVRLMRTSRGTSGLNLGSRQDFVDPARAKSLLSETVGRGVYSSLVEKGKEQARETIMCGYRYRVGSFVVLPAVWFRWVYGTYLSCFRKQLK